MARSNVDRFGDDIAEKFELFQEWWRGAAKELPSAKELRSYLPHRKQERSLALPIALVIGGLAVVGAITVLSTTPISRIKKAGRAVTARKPTEKPSIEPTENEGAGSTSPSTPSSKSKISGE